MHGSVQHAYGCSNWSYLVIQDEARTKRRRDIAGKARGVFRLADTVPGNWVGQGEEGEVLKVRDMIQPRLDSLLHAGR